MAQQIAERFCSPTPLAFCFSQKLDMKISKNYRISLAFGLDGRYTTAPSATEYSLKFIIDLGINRFCKFGLNRGHHTYHENDARNEQDIALNGRHVLYRNYLMSSVTMRFSFFTLFPDLIMPYFGYSIMRNAIHNKKIEVQV